jgi:hypothetical protein
MRDFTLKTYRLLLETLQSQYFQFCTVRQSLKNPPGRYIILRHDVDQKAENSLITAQIEYDLGIKGTYYFRILPVSFDESIVRKIESMGHEIGYHYEELSDFDIRWSSRKITEKHIQKAYERFQDNLSIIRETASVNTISVHGSPLSLIDSRLMWKYFDYGELNIIAEPYFDFSFEEMLYLTDTGRRWDGSSVSIRDRLFTRDKDYYSDWKRKPIAGSAMLMTQRSHELQRHFRFRKTENLIQSIKSRDLPERIMITFHPQRWNDKLSPWLGEYIWQNFKNVIKYFIVR